MKCPRSMALPFCRKRSQSYFVDKKAGSLQNGPLWPPREWQGGYVSLQSHLSNIANIKEPLAWDPEWMDPTLNQSYFLIATVLIFHHIQRTGGQGWYGCLCLAGRQLYCQLSGDVGWHGSHISYVFLAKDSMECRWGTPNDGTFMSIIFPYYSRFLWE